MENGRVKGRQRQKALSSIEVSVGTKTQRAVEEWTLQIYWVLEYVHLYIRLEFALNSDYLRLIARD